MATTVKLELPEELAADLTEQAGRYGMTLDEFLFQVAKQRGQANPPAGLNTPRHDPHLEAAGERVREAAQRAERLGIADAQGKLLRSDLPADMQEGAGRDFGG